ncbi:MAG: leucine-rich repeat domain-containing protein, partial [Clostridia bacterium]|nr:leucine-rich repeat domain-containing protein [Clostridia bacterium]
INVSSTEIDPDGVAQITDLSIYLDDELIASSETFDAATFSELISNHTYKIVLTYEYDLNDGNGVITKTVELSVLTKVLFYPVSAEVGNTSAVSEGEYVYIDVTVVNPGGAVINTVRINGKDYPAIPTSSNEVVRVEIKHENQFEGGLTDFVVESLTATANGETHTYTLDSNNVATVFINGKLIVESIGVVDDEGTLIDYAFPSDFIGIYVALSNKTGYDVDKVVVRDYNQYYGYNRLVFTADQIIMLDQNTLLIPLHDNRYGGIHSYQVEAITYSNFSISGKELTVETERYDVMYFAKDEVVQVSTPEDLLNMNEWAYYELANDIDLNGIEWSTPGDFRGYFDGNYYTIKNMKVATTFENTSANIGLFKNVSGKIENLTLDNIVVTVNASNTLPNQWYEINYGAIASYVDYRIVMNNVRVNHNTVTVNTTGSNINAYVGHLIAHPTDQCYVTNSVVSTGNVTCNSSPVSADYLGQSASKLPAKPTFDTNSDPALFFDSAVTHNGITYLCLNNGVAIVIGFDGSVNDVVIGLDGYKITAIPSRVFYNYDNITSVVIPEGVVTIGYEAFASCDMLASITLPSTLTEIGEGAFRECYALASITLPTSLRIIGDGAFSSCGQLTSIIIPEGVTQIGNHAFQSCWRVTEVTLPSTLTTIGYSAFNGVNARVIFIPAAVTSIGDHAFSQSINIYAAAAKAPSGWSQYWNGEQSNQVTWGVESILTDASGVIYALMGDNTAHVIGYTATLAEAVIGIDGYVVTKIAPYAFQNCDTLVSITIPNTVIEIGEYAFNSCDILKSVTLSNKLTKISKYTFSECDALVSIVIPEGVKVIEEQAFYGCGNLTSVTLPGTLTTIENQAFHYCDIRELILPNSVTKIGEHAFADNYNLTSLTLSSALTSIENYAFAWCEMQNVIIPEGVTSIGDYAFAYCYSIRSVTLPSTLTSIGARAFEGEYLQIVFIPTSVTSIGEYAFSNGTIYTCVPEAPTGWNPSWNGNNREEYVVWGVEKYFTDDYGVTYVLFADGTASIAGVSGTVNEIVLGGNPDFPVTEIPANLLNGRSDITKITIHQSITKIGANAFSGGNWRHIQLPLTVKEIGENAFSENYVYVSNNKKLTDWHENWYGWESNTVVWDAPAGELYTDEVYGNTYLLTEDGWAHLYRYRYQNSELTIAGVEGYKVVVHGGSTNGNWELRKLTLLEGVVKLDDSAFRHNYNLNEITLPASLEEIGAYAFANTSIEKVVLSDSIKTIGKEAFTSGSIFVICATKPEGWHANWCTANTVWDFKDTYTDENGISYVLTNSGYAYVYNYDHEASELIIGGVEGYKVVIGANLFSGNNNITKITLEEGVVEVASYAFAYCNNLTEIVFPASLTTIGDHAFYNTGLEDVKIPVTVEKIGLYAFTCEKIYPDARFQPAGWDTRWFSGNTMNIFWCFKELYEDTDNGITYILHNDGTASVYSFDGTKDTVVIIAPKDHKVTYIYSDVFKQSNIVSITLPDTLTAIGDRAFYDCDSLISIVIPEGVTSIGAEAFHDCDKLFSVTLPSTL